MRDIVCASSRFPGPVGAKSRPSIRPARPSALPSSSIGSVYRKSTDRAKGCSGARPRAPNCRRPAPLRRLIARHLSRTLLSFQVKRKKQRKATKSSPHPNGPRKSHVPFRSGPPLAKPRSPENTFSAFAIFFVQNLWISPLFLSETSG